VLLPDGTALTNPTVQTVVMRLESVS
jgi:hypothetical protein